MMLDETSLTDPDQEVPEVLCALYPPEDPPHLWTTTTTVAALTADLLGLVLTDVSRGFAAGPSGWTC
jgi:hypothetical protein